MAIGNAQSNQDRCVITSTRVLVQVPATWDKHDVHEGKCTVPVFNESPVLYYTHSKRFFDPFKDHQKIN